jgi:hypothetical protein
VAAFYIKSIQQSRAVKNNENNITIQRRSSIPINSVNLEEDSVTTIENANNNSITNSNNLIESEVKQIEKENNRKNSICNLNTNMFNDKFSPDVNEITTNQLNIVNDMMRKINENKTNEFSDKDYISLSTKR